MKLKIVLGCVLFLVAFAVTVMLSGCANQMPPSQYTGPKYANCLICKIAEKNNVRLEDMGNMIRLAGTVGYAGGYLQPSKAVEIYKKIEVALEFPITGQAFVAEVSRLSKAYAPVAQIVLMYSQDFNVPTDLDPQTTSILIKFCNERIAYYQSLLDPAVLPPK